jgi:hypothetical protein
VSEEPAPEVKVDLAEGAKGDIAELTALLPEAGDVQRAEIDALKRRIAELFMGCKNNPHTGELMGAGRHPELPIAAESVSTSRPIKANPASA